MHAIDRGREPELLRPIRKSLTQRWVSYYRHRSARKPTDCRWREFQRDLAVRFYHLCGYCEEACAGEVDHFRPKSRFPELVYEWTNWVLACHTCNAKKRERWPQGGYVDPCIPRHPELYFDYDTVTGEVLPKTALTGLKRQRVIQTVEHLNLNGYHHLKKRTQWLWAISKAIGGLTGRDPVRERLILVVTSRERELSSITRKLLTEMGVGSPIH